MHPSQTDISNFHQMFLDESADLVQVLEAGLLKLNLREPNTEELNSIFRAAHSIKGNAGMTGWESVETFTHTVEAVLDDLRSKRRNPTPQLRDNLLAAVDHIKMMLGRPPLEPIPRQARECLEHLLTNSTQSEAPTNTQTSQPRYRIDWTPPDDCLTRGVEPLRILSSLKSLGSLAEVVCHTGTLPDLSQLNPQTCHLSWTFHLETAAHPDEILEIFTFQAVDQSLAISQLQPPGTTRTPDPKPTETPAPTAPTPQTETVRVAAAKLDTILDLIGELLITQSIAHQTMQAHRGKLPELETTLHDLQRQTRQLQDSIMSLRLVPVDQVFSRFPRLVHDLAHQLGKQIDLETQGDDTEIDRALVEHLSDPLVHLIRNSADHGIETPDQRLRSGKSPTGLIRLQARCQGGSTVVEIEDDGNGLDTEKIRAKALKLGILQPQTKYTEKNIHSLIFHPGFSTADQVTAISGRGVGMDAVRRGIESVSGSIHVHSTPGKGSKFTIHLPMTMAILEGLLVSTGPNVLVLPLASVIECIRTEPHQIQTVPTGHPGEQRELLFARNNLVPLLRLDRMLHFATSSPSPRSKPRMAILIEHNYHQLALLADEIIGQQQVVIKSLETNYRRVEGLQGATILGDGRIALVVDYAAIARYQEKLEQQHLGHRPPSMERLAK